MDYTINPIGASKILPAQRISYADLKPTYKLLDIFEDCHNYIYANQGLLKDKIFSEFTKILLLKLYDEKERPEKLPLFSITKSEYNDLHKAKPSAFMTRLYKLMDLVWKDYPAIFSEPKIYLTPHILAYIVGKLQHISLLSTPADVKGLAFQTFLYKYQRGERGEFFTPYPVVELAINLLNPSPNDRIIDPACGTGGFLVQAIKFLKEKYPELNLSEFIRRNLRGIEFNPDVYRSAVIRILFEGGTGKEIICQNALNEIEKFKESFDIVVTNPPFGSKGKVTDLAILRNYELAKLKGSKIRALSPEILFIEKSLKLLKPGGKLAIVLPEGLLNNPSNSQLREWIKSHSKVIAVVSLPQETFIPFGTGIKTSLLILQKSRHHDIENKTSKIFMAKVKNIGYDSRGNPRKQSDLPVIIEDFTKFKRNCMDFQSEYTFAIDYSDLNNRLDVSFYFPKFLNTIHFLKQRNSKRLGDIAKILKKKNFTALESTKFRYIELSDINYQTMCVSSFKIIQSTQLPSRAKYKVKSGDILVAISGASIGTEKHPVAIIDDEEEGSLCSSGFAVLRDIKFVNPYYLLAFLRSDLFLLQIKRLTTGHAIPSISLKDLENILVYIPSKKEQEEIAQKVKSIVTKYKLCLRVWEDVLEELSFLQVKS